MRIWTIEEEAATLRERFQGVNRAAFARDHEVKGGQAMIYQHITGRRPISIEAAMAYAAGFNCKLEEISPRLALEAQKAAALSSETIAPQVSESIVWPFPSISEADVRSLTPGQLGQLEGAIALAIGQLRLGVDVAPARRAAAPAPRPGDLVDIEAAADEFPMRIGGVPAPWEPGGTTTRQMERHSQGLRISQAVNVGHVEDSGYSANDHEFIPIPELDVRLAAGKLGIENYQETEIGQILLRRSFLESFKRPIKRMRICYGNGPSMEPVIRHRNPMLVDVHPVSLDEVQPRFVYAINRGGKMIVKCLERWKDGRWMAISTNPDPDHHPFPLATDDGGEVRIIGTVLWSPYDLRNGVDERLLQGW
ncbi:S24 family peptidase [Bordetella pertussis]|uniref:S24 family peptidase n=1 Tax=Bordetella pertussis TaxID=520 RepID=UPI001F155452|nr:S24 family peptidase [Bordetella pertussis]